MSADGLAALGSGRKSGAESRPIRWTAEWGMHALELPAGKVWRTYGLSAHGTVVVGSDDISVRPLRQAFFWTASRGPVYLRDHLVSLGIDLTGWKLLDAHGVSYDGSAIVGAGEFGGRTCAWLVTGLFARADYNHDGFVDGIDYDQFMNDFATADRNVQIRADVNFDWFVDGSDYDTFVSDFEAGR